MSPNAAPATGAPLRGVLLLGTASLFWGVAFIPQSFTVVHLDAFTACALRFAMAAPLALLATRGRLAPKIPLRSAVLLGTLLYLAFALQTEALRHTPVARVSLITGLYAIFTPLLSPLLGLPRPRALHLVGATIALLGLLGLIGSFSELASPPNLGDALTLCHALISAVQMVLVGKLTRQAEPFALNAIQLSTMAVLAIGGALLFGAPLEPSTIDAKTWWSFVYLAVFSSFAAFALQLFGQRSVSATVSAAIFLLEAPIGALAAIFLLDEQMAPAQWVGGLILLSGVAISLYAETPHGRTSGAQPPA